MLCLCVCGWMYCMCDALSSSSYIIQSETLCLLLPGLVIAEYEKPRKMEIFILHSVFVLTLVSLRFSVYCFIDNNAIVAAATASTQATNIYWIYERRTLQERKRCDMNMPKESALRSHYLCMRHQVRACTQHFILIERQTRRAYNTQRNQAKVQDKLWESEIKFIYARLFFCVCAFVINASSFVHCLMFYVILFAASAIFCAVFYSAVRLCYSCHLRISVIWWPTLFYFPPVANEPLGIRCNSLAIMLPTYHPHTWSEPLLCGENSLFNIFYFQ